jgi:7-carboxy-7-deazaguanine synthase
MDTTSFMRDNTIITLDFKCKSSGQSGKMFLMQLNSLRPTDVLKCVVGTEEDLKQVLALLQIYSVQSYIYLSPVFGQMELARLADFVVQHKHYNKLRMGLQIHKFVWNPNERGV